MRNLWDTVRIILYSKNGKKKLKDFFKTIGDLETFIFIYDVFGLLRGGVCEKENLDIFESITKAYPSLIKCAMYTYAPKVIKDIYISKVKRMDYSDIFNDLRIGKEVINKKWDCFSNDAKKIVGLETSAIKHIKEAISLIKNEGISKEVRKKLIRHNSCSVNLNKKALQMLDKENILYYTLRNAIFNDYRICWSIITAKIDLLKYAKYASTPKLFESLIERGAYLVDMPSFNKWYKENKVKIFKLAMTSSDTSASVIIQKAKEKGGENGNTTENEQDGRQDLPTEPENQSSGGEAL